MVPAEINVGLFRLVRFLNTSTTCETDPSVRTQKGPGLSGPLRPLGPGMTQWEKRGAVVKIYVIATSFDGELAAVLITLSAAWQMARTVRS